MKARKSTKRPQHKKAEKKPYKVYLDPRWMATYEVMAVGTKEAKQKVWNRMRRRLAPPAALGFQAERQ